jgi:hypothetical protein
MSTEPTKRRANSRPRLVVEARSHFRWVVLMVLVASFLALIGAGTLDLLAPNAKETPAIITTCLCAFTGGMGAIFGLVGGRALK